MEPEYLKITIGPDEKTIVFPVVFDQSEDLWTVDCAYFDERATGESKEQATQTFLDKLRPKLEKRLGL